MYKYYQTPNNLFDSKIKKLVILFLFEKMSIPLTEEAILDICTSENEWLGYMECKQFLDELIDSNLLYKVPKSELINITQDGVGCLSMFYTRMPTSMREDIAAYVNQNRLRFKKKQSYFCDYSKNADGSYTVLMRINTDLSPLLDMKLVVANRQHAKYIYKNWEEKASQIYAILHDNLLE